MSSPQSTVQLGFSVAGIDQAFAQVSKLQTGLQRVVDAGREASKTFSTILNPAIEATGKGIAGLIQGTLNWGQALRNIGSSILTGVINSISRMFAEWIAGRALAAARNIFFAQTEGAAETAAKAPGAILTSISSYGAAAAIGLAAVVAALAAFAFNEGGMVPGAPSSRDNRLAHVATGEYITRAAAVQYYGPGLFEALNSFQIPRGSLEGMRVSVPPSFARSSFASGGLVSAMPAAASNVNVAPAPVTVVVVKDQRELEDFMQSHRGGQIVIQHVARQRSNLGIRS